MKQTGDAPPVDKYYSGENQKPGLYKIYHDSTASGHPGYEKTLELIQRLYWWPTMKQDIKEYVESCETC